MVKTGKKQDDLTKIWNILSTIGILLTVDLILVIMGALSFIQCFVWGLK